MDEQTSAAPEGAGEATAIDQATAVDRIMALDAPETEQTTAPEATVEAAAELEANGETTEGEQPSTEQTEPEPDTELQLKGDAKTRLRDGREVSIADLKRRFEKADEFEAELGKAREREAQIQQTAQQQQLLQQHLPSILQLMQAQMPKRPDPELADSDPFEFVKQTEMFNRRVEELKAVEAANQEQRQKAQEAHNAEQARYLKEQNELILDKLPELRDPEKAKVFKDGYEKAATHYGFSAQEAAQVYDHRLLVMINDAMQFRALQAQKAEAVEKAKQPTGTAPMSPQRRQGQAERNSQVLNDAVARARKSGSFEDAVSAIGALG